MFNLGLRHIRTLNDNNLMIRFRWFRYRRWWRFHDNDIWRPVKPPKNYQFHDLI